MTTLIGKTLYFSLGYDVCAVCRGFVKTFQGCSVCMEGEYLHYSRIDYCLKVIL